MPLGQINHVSSASKASIVSREGGAQTPFPVHISQVKNLDRFTRDLETRYVFFQEEPVDQVTRQKICGGVKSVTHVTLLTEEQADSYRTTGRFTA